MKSNLLIAPAIFIVSYLSLGVAIAAFGPLEYRGFNTVTVFTYMSLTCISISIGFVFATKIRTPINSNLIPSKNQASLTAIFRISLILSSAVMTYEIAITLVSGGLSFSLSEAANSYFSSYSNYERNSGNYSLRFMITSLAALPTFIAQILGVLYFKEIDKGLKLVVIYIFIVTILVYTLGGGKQKQFGDIMIYIISIVIAKQAATGKLKFKTLAKVGGGLACGLYVLLALLSFRYQAIGVDLAELNYKIHPLIQYREDNFLAYVLGDTLAFPIVMFSGYLGQGYYGLSLSLEQPFTWTSFAGSSYSMSVILNQFFGAHFWVTDNYPYHVGYATGWDQTKWHTVFAWLASDLTFTGVIFFFGVMGFIYGRAWREIVLHQNPFAIMLFAMMNVGWAYAPANNQLMHSPGGLSTTFGVFILYYLYHKKFNAAPTTIRGLRFRIRI